MYVTGQAKSRKEPGHGDQPTKQITALIPTTTFNLVLLNETEKGDSG